MKAVSIIGLFLLGIVILGLGYPKIAAVPIVLAVIFAILYSRK